MKRRKILPMPSSLLRTQQFLRHLFLFLPPLHRIRIERLYRLKLLRRSLLLRRLRHQHIFLLHIRFELIDFDIKLIFFEVLLHISFFDFHLRLDHILFDLIRLLGRVNLRFHRGLMRREEMRNLFLVK